MSSWSVSKPSSSTIEAFLQHQSNLTFSYRDVGASASTPPVGYVVDHTRVLLGRGESAFQRAKAALQRWEHFQLGWVTTFPRDVSIQSGQVVAVLGKILGVWWLNACRIVYVVDESGPIFRFGFAYGTLPGHAESGEERFIVEWNREDNSVSYDILAFSKPNYLVTRLAYPIVRHFQKKFARHSAAAMINAVSI